MSNKEKIQEIVEIKNEILKVKIETLGAQLSSISDSDGHEYLWQKNMSPWWDKSAPILFPIIGRLFDGTYTFKGKKYSLGGHGFVSDVQFDVVEKYDSKVVLVYCSNYRHRDIYPFEFNLSITFEVVGKKLVQNFKVANLSDDEMYYSIGGHPAFNIDKNKEIKLRLFGRENSTVNRYVLKDSFLDKIIEAKKMNYSLIKDSFVNDALVFDNIEYLELYQDDLSIIMTLDNIPLIGIWAQLENNEMSPFVCLEPWVGIADKIGHNGSFVDKYLIQKLDAGNVNYYSFSTTFARK